MAGSAAAFVHVHENEVHRDGHELACPHGESHFLRQDLRRQGLAHLIFPSLCPGRTGGLALLLQFPVQVDQRPALEGPLEVYGTLPQPGQEIGYE